MEVERLKELTNEIYTQKKVVKGNVLDMIRLSIVLYTTYFIVFDYLYKVLTPHEIDVFARFFLLITSIAIAFTCGYISDLIKSIKRLKKLIEERDAIILKSNVI